MTQIEKTLIASQTFTLVEKAIARAKRAAVQQLWTIVDFTMDEEEIRLYLAGEAQPLIISSVDFLDFYNYGKSGRFSEQADDVCHLEDIIMRSLANDEICKYLRFTEGMKHVRFESDQHINDPEVFDEDSFEEAMRYYEQ